MKPKILEDWQVNKLPKTLFPEAVQRAKDIVENSNFKQITMNKEEVKNDISVSSRLKYINDEKDIKVAEFIMDYAFKDEKEVYTNGAILVPLYRVLDAISQKGKQYQDG